MKKYLFLIILSFTVLLFSCHEDDIITFRDGREIYFDKFYVNAMSPGTESADSTVTSFFFYPDKTQDITVNVVVNLSGFLLTSDMKFQLKVISEETTATPNEYTLSDFYTFRANNVGEDAKEVKDTIQIALHRSARLDDMPDGVRLVVELVPNDECGLGQIERIRAKIVMTTMAMKPEWWTKEVTDGLLGDYSQKKFKLFLNHVDLEGKMGADMIENHPDEAIKLVMAFKQWLSEQDLETITDVDGSLIQVKI